MRRIVAKLAAMWRWMFGVAEPPYGAAFEELGGRFYRPATSTDSWFISDLHLVALPFEQTRRRSRGFWILGGVALAGLTIFVIALSTRGGGAVEPVALIATAPAPASVLPSLPPPVRAATRQRLASKNPRRVSFRRSGKRVSLRPRKG